MDQNRLQQKSRRVDETARERASNRARRDPRELVSRRPTANGPPPIFPIPPHQSNLLPSPPLPLFFPLPSSTDNDDKIDDDANA